MFSAFTAIFLEYENLQLLRYQGHLTSSFFLTQSMSSMKSFSACSWEYWNVLSIVKISWSRNCSGIVLQNTQSYYRTCTGMFSLLLRSTAHITAQA